MTHSGLSESPPEMQREAWVCDASPHICSVNTTDRQHDTARGNAVSYCRRCRGYGPIRTPPNPLWLHFTLTLCTLGLWVTLWMRISALRTCICLNCGGPLRARAPSLRLETAAEMARLALTTPLILTAAVVKTGLEELQHVPRESVRSDHEARAAPVTPV